MAYTGMRVGEVTALTTDDITATSIRITDGKTDSGNRTLPIPMWLGEELLASDFKWFNKTYLNQKIKCADPEITCHSMRHGWKRLSREAELDSVLAEAFLGTP